MFRPASPAMRRRLCAAFAFAALLAALLAPSAASGQETPAQLLVGKWKHVEMRRTVDGRDLATQPGDGKSTAEFFANGTWSADVPNNKSAGTYRWLDANHIEQTTLESGLAIQIGLTSRRQVIVDAGRLELVIVQTRADMDKYMPPARPGVSRPNEVVIHTVFARLRE